MVKKNKKKKQKKDLAVKSYIILYEYNIGKLQGVNFQIFLSSLG